MREEEEEKNVDLMFPRCWMITRKLRIFPCSFIQRTIS